jgi:hypothetical protein
MNKDNIKRNLQVEYSNFKMKFENIIFKSYKLVFL